MITLTSRSRQAAPLSDVEYVSEVQISNPTITVRHLKNGLKEVHVGKEMGYCTAAEINEAIATLGRLNKALG